MTNSINIHEKNIIEKPKRKLFIPQVHLMGPFIKDA
jgi:hypothetical protein